MKEYQQDFLQVALKANILKYGTFTLNSGRVSPYFFNAGLFCNGPLLNSLASAYSSSIIEELSDLEYDIVFGPAYKGIPLAVSTVIKLCERGKDVSYSFNRKEPKDHGEGGTIVGASLKDKRVLIIDDVLTSGKAIREAFTIIEQAGGKVVAVVVAVDRCEQVREGGKSAIGSLKAEKNIPVHAIISVHDIIDFTESQVGKDEANRLKEYQSRYGAE